MQSKDKEQLENEARLSNGEIETFDDIPIHIEGYELVREMNEGGQAVVFQAIKTSTGRKVAIKILIDGPTEAEIERSRMEREIRILATLDHSNIVSIIDRGETREGWLFFVMEYVQGHILAEYMDEQRENYPVPGIPADCRDILRLFVRICDAVHAAHLRGIVHRDLKPSNIVVDPYGEPHILDFGVACAPLFWLAGEEEKKNDTVSGEFLGSLLWASPEQVEAEPDQIDIRSDVYSLGIILYEMLTGAFPYEVFSSIREVIENITDKKPNPPSTVIEEVLHDLPKTNTKKHLKNPIDPVLDTIVLKALAKSPAGRYQSAGEFSKAITEYLTEHAKMPAASSWVQKWIIPGIIAGGLLIILMAILFTRRTPTQEQYPSSQVANSPIIIQNENIYGYRVENEEIIFEFDPREYDVARMSDGSLGTIQTVEEMYTVNVAGPFNNWIKNDKNWALLKRSRNLFELRKAMSNFVGRAEWPFKFVVNNSVWVGAPKKAENKMLVAEDTATYNLIVANPYLTSDQETAMLRMYRDRINRIWPGQGWNLTVNTNHQYQFTLTHLKETDFIHSLDALQDVPLVRLDLGETKITDFSALKSMTNLTWLTCNDTTYYSLITGILPALEDGDFTRAAKQASNVFSTFSRVPACSGFRQLLETGVANMSDLLKQPDAIPETAYTFNDHRYAYILLSMNWPQAELYARRHHGHLAVVNSPEEQAWISQTFGWGSLGRIMWLGASDAQKEGDWIWVNSEPWAYNNWTHPEPNNNNNDEHYLAMKPDGWWMDVNGDVVQYPFLIEWD